MSAPPPTSLAPPPPSLTGHNASGNGSGRSGGNSTTTSTANTSTVGRISPHLHLDLSCVSVPPLPSSAPSSGGGGGGSSGNDGDHLILRRCRSDSEATLGSASSGFCSSSGEELRSCRGAGASSGGTSSSAARPDIEPPPWAIEAKGEARLEPVCESLGIQQPIDLTRRACFRVGRSPNSDVRLLHATCSRRHALLFHHPNGSCYVVDCGSAHGTYVNGVRVKSGSSAGEGARSAGARSTGTGAAAAGRSGGGMVIPHRVRRGALIRFGGPGAPCFVLKSFAVGFDALVKDLGGTYSGSTSTAAAGCGSSTDDDDAKRHHEVSEYSCGTLLSGVNQDLASEVTKRLLGFGALPVPLTGSKSTTGTSRTSTSSAEPKQDEKQQRQQGDDAAASSTADAATDADVQVTDDATKVESTAALLQINTRLNALGGTESLSPHGRKLAQDATVQLLDRLRAQARERSLQLLLGLGPYGSKKHGREDDDSSDAERAMPSNKRRRLMMTVDVADAPPSGATTTTTITKTNPVLVSPVTAKQSFFAASSPLPSRSSSMTSGTGTTAPPSIPTSSLSLLDTPSSIRPPILSLPPSMNGGVTGAAVRKVSSDGSSPDGDGGGGGSGASTPPLRRNRSSRDPNRRVKFSEQTECVYAPSVTPDEISHSFDSEDGDGDGFATADHQHQQQMPVHHHAPKTPRGASAAALQ